MLSRITLATEDALTWPWYQRLVLTLNSAQHTLGWMWLWNIITPVTVWVRYLNLSLIWRELKQSFPFPPHPGNCSVAGRQWDLISQSRFVFWSCWWEQTSWPRGRDFISGVIGAVLPCLQYEEPECRMLHVFLEVPCSRDFSTGWTGCGEGTCTTVVYSGVFHLTELLWGQKEISPGLYREVLQVLSVLTAFWGYHWKCPGTLQIWGLQQLMPGSSLCLYNGTSTAQITINHSLCERRALPVGLSNNSPSTPSESILLSWVYMK